MNQDTTQLKALEPRAYFVVSGTGCTCCNNEDVIFGPFLKLEEAQEEARLNHRTKNWASQYAPNGRHEIGWALYEELPDGRLIIGDRVLQSKDLDHFLGLGHPKNFYDLGLTYLDFDPNLPTPTLSGS